MNSDKKKTRCDWLFTNNPDEAVVDVPISNRTLRWTHNTPYETLLYMITNRYKSYHVQQEMSLFNIYSISRKDKPSLTQIKDMIGVCQGVRESLTFYLCICHVK